MAGLSMRGFGSNSESSSNHLDLSSLENNPRFNAAPEGEQPPVGEPAEPIIETPAEPVGQVNNEGENGVEQSTPTTPDLNTTPEVTRRELTDEEREQLIFSSLSEKLGREVKSYEDLAQPAAQAEIDPQIKAIAEWKEKTGRPVEDFFKFQKDFSQVSDLEIAREFLQMEYPMLNREEIELELESFTAQEDDLDSEIAKKGLELKKYAAKGRKELEKLKAELGEPSPTRYSPEVMQKIAYAEEVAKQIQQNQSQQADYAKGINQAAMASEVMKLNLTDDFSIDFRLTEQERKTLPKLIEEMPHWRTEDGKWNHKAVVEDAIKIKHFDSMLKLAYEQGLNAGKDDILRAAKNSTLGTDVSAGAAQDGGTKKPIIEDIDRLLGGQKLTMKFGRK